MDQKKQLKAYIDPETFKLFKMLSAREDKSISEYVEELIEREFEKKSKRYVYHKNSSCKAYFFCSFFLASLWAFLL